VWRLFDLIASELNDNRAMVAWAPFENVDRDRDSLAEDEVGLFEKLSCVVRRDAFLVGAWANTTQSVCVEEFEDRLVPAAPIPFATLNVEVAGDDDGFPGNE
jgi:hypothetical protein